MTNLTTGNNYEDLMNRLVDSLGEKEAMNTLARMSGYDKAPPTVQEFIDDDMYLGETLSKTLYPTWRNALYEIYPNPFYSPYQEVVLSGAIGLGKSSVSIAGSLYDLCKILHLKNPQEHFKLISSTQIMVGLLNATMGLAGSVLMDQINDWMINSPFFKSKMNKKGSKAPTLFPKNVGIVSGSRPSHILGKAIFTAIISELNFMNKVKGQAKDNYSNIVRRMQSRFLSAGGNLPGHVWLDSSVAEQDSFLDEHIKNTLHTGNIRVYSYSVWEVKKHMGLYSGETFPVFIGSESRDPFIMTNSQQSNGLDDSLFIDVPVEFRKQFEGDIYNGLRDIAGVSTISSAVFIPSKAKIHGCMHRPNPCDQEVIVTDFYDRSDRLIDHLDIDPLIDESRHQRYIHIDLGISGDATGFAASRFDGFIEIKRSDIRTGEDSVIRVPKFCTEIAIGIKAKPGQQVPIYKIKELIIDMRSRGYPIKVVSTDGYQSTNLRQDLSLEGFECQLVSCDRNKSPYHKYKEVILEDRWSSPVHGLLKKELETLVENSKKIDHPESSCFLGDTLVEISDHCGNISKMRFDELIDTDASQYLVKSYSDTGETTFSQFHNVRISKYVEEYVEVQTESTLFKCTLDHRILVDRSGDVSYVEAGNLSVNDAIVTINDDMSKSVTKVTSVITVINSDLVPVYDLTCPIFQNFTIDGGLVVHNSKDVADAVCGSVWQCYQNMDEAIAEDRFKDYTEQMGKGRSNSLYDQIVKASSRR